VLAWVTTSSTRRIPVAGIGSSKHPTGAAPAPVMGASRHREWIRHRIPAWLPGSPLESNGSTPGSTRRSTRLSRRPTRPSSSPPTPRPAFASVPGRCTAIASGLPAGTRPSRSPPTPRSLRRRAGRRTNLLRPTVGRGLVADCTRPITVNEARLGAVHRSLMAEESAAVTAALASMLNVDHLINGTAPPQPAAPMAGWYPRFTHIHFDSLAIAGLQKMFAILSDDLWNATEQFVIGLRLTSQSTPPRARWEVSLSGGTVIVGDIHLLPTAGLNQTPPRPPRPTRCAPAECAAIGRGPPAGAQPLRAPRLARLTPYRYPRVSSSARIGSRGRGALSVTRHRNPWARKRAPDAAVDADLRHRRSQRHAPRGQVRTGSSRQCRIADLDVRQGRPQ
jgi:hypothetical protein